MEHPEILLVGSANAVFEAIQSDGEPLYESSGLSRSAG